MIDIRRAYQIASDDYETAKRERRAGLITVDELKTANQEKKSAKVALENALGKKVDY
jgi:hypothetical protein